VPDVNTIQGVLLVDFTSATDRSDACFLNAVE